MSAPNPNRYAAPAEAMILRGEIAGHMEARKALEKRAVSAATALHDTEVALRAAQEAHDAARRIVAYIEQQQRSVDELVLVAQGLLHPIRRLPDEVLSMIFEVVPTFRPKRPILSGSLKPRRPFVISAVCRRWRAVALSTPALWNTFHCNIPQITGGDRAKRWALYLETHCDRARGLVLDVALIFGNLDPSMAADPFWRALADVYIRSKRFTARLHGGFTHRMRACLSFHAPHLEELTFNEPEDLEGAAPARPLALNAPCLKTLCYDGAKLPFSHTEVCHTIRIVHLSAGSFTAGDLANLFRVCPGLVDLSATVEADFTSLRSIVISAQRLETINLTMTENSTMDMNVAQSFSFPSLRQASLDIDNTSDLQLGVLGAFIASAFRTVKSLELECNITLPPGTEQGLAACVQLEQLSLNFCNFDAEEENLALALSAAGSSQWICPQLRKLSLVIQPEAMRPTDRHFADVMSTIATTRCTAPTHLGVHPLEKLSVDFYSWYHDVDAIQPSDAIRIDALQRRLDTILTAS